MLEDPFDHHRVFDTGNDLYPHTTVSAGLYLDPEYALEKLGLKLKAAWRSDTVFTASPRQSRALLPGVSLKPADCYWAR